MAIGRVPHVQPKNKGALQLWRVNHAQSVCNGITNFYAFNDGEMNLVGNGFLDVRDSANGNTGKHLSDVFSGGGGPATFIDGPWGTAMNIPVDTFMENLAGVGLPFWGIRGPMTVTMTLRVNSLDQTAQNYLWLIGQNPVLGYLTLIDDTFTTFVQRDTMGAANVITVPNEAYGGFGQWWTCAVTYDTHRTAVYLNGSLYEAKIASQEFSTEPLASDQVNITGSGLDAALSGPDTDVAAFGIWRRVLLTDEIGKLAMEPLLPIMEDQWEDRHQVVPPPATLPCPGFPYTQRVTDPTDESQPLQTTVDVLLAKAATRVNRRTVEIDLSLLEADELGQVLYAWGEGVGQVRPATVTLPGEASASKLIFAGDLPVEALTATARSVRRLTLIDVTFGY